MVMVTEPDPMLHFVSILSNQEWVKDEQGRATWERSVLVGLERDGSLWRYDPKTETWSPMSMRKAP